MPQPGTSKSTETRDSQPARGTHLTRSNAAGDNPVERGNGRSCVLALG